MERAPSWTCMSSCLRCASWTCGRYLQAANAMWNVLLLGALAAGSCSSGGHSRGGICWVLKLRQQVHVQWPAPPTMSCPHNKVRTLPDMPLPVEPSAMPQVLLCISIISDGCSTLCNMVVFKSRHAPCRLPTLLRHLQWPWTMKPSFLSSQHRQVQLRMITCG
jgi:hypothetical protein